MTAVEPHTWQLPAPGEVTATDLAAVCTTLAARVDEITDLAHAVDLLPKLQAIETYLVAAGQRKDPAQTAARLLEARIGELLGPPPGPGRPSNLTRPSDSLIDSRRHDFRLMAQWKDRWRKQLPASREDIIRLCRAFKREHTPARPDLSITDTEQGGLRVLHGDFRERLADLPDGSVDLILTDPPYPKEDLWLWGELSREAARLLGPRGLLAAYTGKISLPDVMAGLAQHLTYGWAYCLLLDGSHSRIMGRHVMQSWRPVLVYSTGTWPSRDWHTDLIESPAQEKSLYRWQQPVPAAASIISRLCPPDGLVVDPMMGVGSFGEAARQAGRRFIGVELDAGRYQQARDRLLGP